MSDFIIELRNINKIFDEDIVLNDISFNIRKNEFLTLLGPSGCGKTTTLRIIGGFEFPTSGDVLFESKNILDTPPHKRHLNTVFQKYALFPNMNVFENIAFGLKIRKIDNKIIQTQVTKMLELVNLRGFEKRSVSSLSGGQQQRIAIARALVNEPRLLLLDEPLGALDLKLRKGMQIELKNMQQELGITFVYVTHDQEEALTMSDTIAIMNNGSLQQIGKPEDIYNEPKNSFVADFVGESNIIDGVMLEDFLVQFSDSVFKCVDKGFGENISVDVVIRPEDIQIVNEENANLKGTVKNVTFKGVHYEMLVESYDFVWKVHSTVMSPEGTFVNMRIGPNEIHIMKKVIL